jgi:hypothetical protein
MLNYFRERNCVAKVFDLFPKIIGWVGRLSVV